jgi:hypothetical protein
LEHLQALRDQVEPALHPFSGGHFIQGKTEQPLPGQQVPLVQVLEVQLQVFWNSVLSISPL